MFFCVDQKKKKENTFRKAEKMYSMKTMKKKKEKGKCEAVTKKEL